MSVRLFSANSGAHHHHPNADASARARVHLKLAALSWANACLGSAAPPMMAMAGVGWLCDAARAYYEALTGRSFTPRDDMRWLGDLPPPDAPTDEVRIATTRAQLALGAVSYVASRHGADACIEFTRAAIGTLCDAAIRYCEALSDAPEGEPRVVDRTMHLDDGS